MKIAWMIAALAASGGALAQTGHHAHHQESEMTGALGPQPMSREASGTAWQPDASPMEGVHFMAGEWTGMLHGNAFLVYDDQGGPRGDEDVFVPSMLMAMGQRPLGAATLGLRGMLSLDPLMGKDGYPLLFQTGETADGEHELVDRQHPHDAFMELAATFSVPLGAGSAFVYAGLPGEPALGPATFMHRASAIESPEAPLTHHWLDSTHITFGVVTLGLTGATWKLEGSAFNGREPDQHRWNIETGPLDSYSARATWNPSPAWSMQLSHGALKEPEQLEPGVDVDRTTASVSHELDLGHARWSTTLAAGLNRSDGHDRWGLVAETTRRDARGWGAFGRVERIETDHLVHHGPLEGRAFAIGKLSLGAFHDFHRDGPVRLGVGALASAYAVPAALEAEYGAAPVSFMVYLRAALSGSR